MGQAAMVLPLFPAAFLPPSLLRSSKIASAGQRIPIVGWEAYRSVRGFKSPFTLKPPGLPLLLDIVWPFLVRLNQQGRETIGLDY